MDVDDSRRYARLIDAIIRLYREEAGVAGSGVPMQNAAADFLAEVDVGRLALGAKTRSAERAPICLPPGRPKEGLLPLGGKVRSAKGAQMPVRRHIPAVIAAARRGPLAQLADAFIAVEPISDWLQNPNYTVDTIGRAFLDNYGYIELVGPGRLVESDAFLIGFLLLGPHTLYPDHNHQAAEVYHVVAGIGQWWREDQDWTTRLPGAAIVHSPCVRHAMRSGDAPLLALYCWQGEIATAARLCQPDA